MPDFPQDAPDFILRTQARSNRFAAEAIMEVLSRMPWDQEITLMSTGTPIKAAIVRMSDVFWRADDNPHRDGGNPIYESAEQKQKAEEYDKQYGRPRFMFDVEWETGHIEFTVAQTGWGGVPDTEIELTPVSKEDDTLPD